MMQILTGIQYSYQSLIVFCHKTTAVIEKEEEEKRYGIIIMGCSLCICAVKVMQNV